MVRSHPGDLPIRTSLLQYLQDRSLGPLLPILPERGTPDFHNQRFRTYEVAYRDQERRRSSREFEVSPNTPEWYIQLDQWTGEFAKNALIGLVIGNLFLVAFFLSIM